MTPSTGKTRRTFAAFGNPLFPFLWTGLLFSFLSFSVQVLARGYLAYELTGSAAAIGWIQLAWGIPMFALAAFAGVVADRFPKRTILFFTQGTLGVTALITAVLTHLGIVEIWHLVVLGFLQGVAFGFNVPTRQAIVPEVTTPETMANGIALINSGSSLAQIVGFPISGVLIAIPFIGITGTMYVSAFLYSVVILMYFQLPNSKRSSTIRQSFVSQMFEGFRYVGQHPVLPWMMLMCYVPWMIGQPYQSQMPVIASSVLNIGADLLGFLNAAAGIGALCGSLVVATIATTRYKGRFQVAAGLSFGTSLLLFGTSTNYWLSLVTLFIIGLSSNMFMTFNNSNIVEMVDRNYYGRVLSVSSLAGSMGSLFSLPYGMAMDAFGPGRTVQGSGVFIAIFVATIAILVPAIMRPSKPVANEPEVLPIEAPAVSR